MESVHAMPKCQVGHCLTTVASRGVGKICLRRVIRIPRSLCGLSRQQLRRAYDVRVPVIITIIITHTRHDNQGFKFSHMSAHIEERKMSMYHHVYMHSIAYGWITLLHGLFKEEGQSPKLALGKIWV